MRRTDTFLVVDVQCTYMETETDTEIATGTDYDVEDPEADVRAYADNGEFATTWDVRRVDETTVEVAYYRWEAGLCYGDGVDEFGIDAEKPTEQFARELTRSDPQEAIRLAREAHQ